MKSSNPRSIKQYMSTSNKNITARFQDFWTQKIGKENKIEVEIELKNREASHKMAGEPYLQFWIKDSEHTLHPKQRSKGVRWFISFYLSLKADAMVNKDSKSIFLIDEPGASLHARAQEDVLKVFEDIQTSNQIIYTTHSQNLIEFNNIHRLLAVQRKDESDEESDTVVIPAYHLGSASTNTLAPILGHMGIDFSDQNVISKRNNIILEEINAYYYLIGFSKLFSKSDYNYLPATGVSNIKQLALLFLGWGLKFGIVMDDDSAGRNAYNGILKDIFQNNNEVAIKNMYKLKKCDGIEDVFSEEDFLQKILGIEKPNNLNYKNNSELAKLLKISKPITALNFYIAVRDNILSIDSFSDNSKKGMKELMDNIDILIANQQD
ncbi:ATP-dependent nuclease [Hymenobacter sp. HDW8]|uniref:ATP-dependent nuclease n=1 Tax=Hymenobacter sp. HDW8 TaxID=2714932 RepID=UPI001F1170A2|nr:AAA family ATPase [Hymenobacter sp. HDW8]